MIFGNTIFATSMWDLVNGPSTVNGSGVYGQNVPESACKYSRCAIRKIVHAG